MTVTYTYTDINFPGSANQGTSVVGINNSGEVSGSYIATDGSTHGFTEVNGTYTTVDYPSPSIDDTYGQKLNNDGDVVGWFPYSGYGYGYINNNGSWTGFSLGVSSYTIATGVNDADVIVGYAYFGQNHYSGFATISVSATPGASTYTKLDVPNSSQTFATDINDSGVIVGSYNSLIDHLNHGFVYDGTTWTTLDVTGYPSTTNPQGINDAGDIVGFVIDAQNVSHGFVYSNGTYTITDVPGATDTRFYDINDSGQIVGYSSNHHGFVATPGPSLEFTTPASVVGIAQEGQVLTADGAVNDPLAVISYQWQLDGADILGATSSAYTVAETDEGHTIRVIETATAGGATATSTSDPTLSVTDITLGFTSGASINNTSPKEGDVLRAINGSLNDGDAGVTGYQWQQQVGGVWTDIVGATSQTYAVKKSNDNHELRVIETATDTDGGPTITSVSDPTAAVIPTQSPPPGTSAFLFQSSGGLYEVYVLGDNEVLAGGYSLGDVYGELGGITYLNGALDHVSMVVHDTLTGEVKSINVQDNRVVGETHLGAVGVDWDISGFRSEEHVGDGMVMRNATAGDLEGYSISNGQIVSADQMGKVGLDWKVEGFGNFGDTPGGMVMRNEQTGELEVYDIKGNSITGASSLGTVGTDWKVSGFGDFNGDGSTDMLMRNSVTGGLQLYEIAGDKITNTSFLGTIGNEWEFGG